MANVTALLTIAFLLCSMLMCTARPDPTFFASITVSSVDEAASVTISSADEPCNMEKKIEGKLDDMPLEENCGANDEDCLLRRTLVAHTDYIYTQKKKHH